MALVVGTNSYVDVAFADAYFAERLFADEWATADAAIKPIALIHASRRIDRLRLRGVPKDLGQALAFPRCYDDADDARRYNREIFGSAGLIFDATNRYAGLVCDEAVPEVVLRAACEEALALLSSNGQSARAQLQADGVKSYSIGRLSETFVDGARPSKLASLDARDLLRPYLANDVHIAMP